MDTSENNFRARALYRRLGYREAGAVSCTFNGLPGVALVGLEKNADRRGRNRMYVEVSYPKEKEAFYALLREQIGLYCGEETDRTAVLANASGVLAQAFPQANWACFYLVQGEELVLGPYQGKPAVSRIGYGRGVCGTAWKEGRSQVVEEVSCFPGHIACDCGSRSEIVIPLRRAGGEIWGVLDMDSVLPAYFTQADREGLEALVPLLDRENGG